MAGMNEIGTSYAQLPGEANGVVQQLMRVVRFSHTKSIDHKHVKAFKIRQLGGGYGLHVCDISKLTKAIAINRQFSVHHPKREDVDVANTERLVRWQYVKSYGGDTRISVFGKTIRQHFEHSLPRLFIGIDVDFPELAVGPYVIHTANVVVVRMSNQYTVNASERHRHQLLTEIGTAIYKKPSRVGL